MYFFWTLAHAWILDTEVEQKSIQMLMLSWRLREHGSALSFQISSFMWWLVHDMKNKRKNLFLLHILFWDQVKHKSILVSLQYYGCRTKFWISFGFWTLAQIWIFIFSVVFWNFGSMRKNIQLIHIIKHLYFPQFFIIS